MIGVGPRPSLDARMAGVRAETEDELSSALAAAAAAHRDDRYSLIEVILAPGDVASVLAKFMGLQK